MRCMTNLLYILTSYFQSLAASFFDIRTQGVSKVSCTNSYVELEICMSIFQTDSMCRWQHHFWHTNMGCCQKYCILIPMYNHKFVWPYFKQIDLIFPALVFAYKLQSPSKVCITNSYVTLEICMTILQTAICVAGSILFGIRTWLPSKVSNTNSYIYLEICMSILQTASLCRWQHHFWHTNMVTFESI